MLRDQLRASVEAGILIGVKWAIIVVLVLLGVSYFLTDYSVVRGRAFNGEQAWELIQKQIQAQGQPTQNPVTPPPSKK